MLGVSRLEALPKSKGSIQNHTAVQGRWGRVCEVEEVRECLSDCSWKVIQHKVFGMKQLAHEGAFAGSRASYSANAERPKTVLIICEESWSCPYHQHSLDRNESSPSSMHGSTCTLLLS